MNNIVMLTLFGPGYVIATTIRKTKGSRLYKKRPDTPEFQITAVLFSILIYHAFVSIILTRACGYLGSDLVGCANNGGAMEFMSDYWLFFLAVYKGSFETILLGAVLVLYLLNKASGAKGKKKAKDRKRAD